MPKILNFVNRSKLFHKLYLRRASASQIANILRIAFLRLFFKARYPLSILLGLTFECQCSCKHCGLDRLDASSGSELTFEEICDFINELSGLGIANITFVGGEPILRKDVFEIIKIASLKGFFTSLDSNGLLLNSENVKKLKKSGLTLVKISLDSSVPEIHDKNRGIEGCFEKAMLAIKNCVFAGIPCIVTTVATKEIVRNGDLGNIVSLAKGIGASALQVEFLAYSGRVLKGKYEFLDEEDLEYVRNICDYSYVYHSSIFSEFLKCSCLSKLNCYVSPAGDLKACMYLPLKFGNIRKKDFKSLWEKMSLHSLYKFSSKDCYERNSYFRDSKYLA